MSETTERPILDRLATFFDDYDAFYNEPVPMLATQLCADAHDEITSLRAQLEEAQKQLEIKDESEAAFGGSQFDVLKYSFDLVSHYREVDGSIRNQMAVNLSHMMAHSFNNVRLQWAQSLGFKNPGDLDRSVRGFKSQLEEARVKAIEECARIANGYYSEDNECAKAIRALLNGSTK